MLTFTLPSSFNPFTRLQDTKNRDSVATKCLSDVPYPGLRLDCLSFLFEFSLVMMPVTTTAQAESPPHKLPTTFSTTEWRYLSMEVNTSPQAMQCCSTSSAPGKLFLCLNIEGSACILLPLQCHLYLHCKCTWFCQSDFRYFDVDVVL